METVEEKIELLRKYIPLPPMDAVEIKIQMVDYAATLISAAIADPRGTSKFIVAERDRLLSEVQGLRAKYGLRPAQV